jgi:hypothetical protein
VKDVLELGNDHELWFCYWGPDLSLNPDLIVISEHLPAKLSAIMKHKLPDGEWCEGVITFDLPLARTYFSPPYWKVECWDPLTLSPSLKCACGDHGFVQQGRWVPA